MKTTVTVPKPMMPKQMPMKQMVKSTPLGNALMKRAAKKGLGNQY